MKLPRLSNKPKPTERSILNFGGLNRTEGAEAGELAAGVNLSSTEFPSLSQRRGREVVAEYPLLTDLFAWNNHLVAVDGTNLRYDGEVVGNVTPGEKQFAVVNTRLCIFPDKAFLDLNNRKFGTLYASIQSKAGTSVTFTTNSITLEVAPKMWTTNEIHIVSAPQQANMITQSYSSVSWVDGAWVKDGFSEGLYALSLGRYFIPYKTGYKSYSIRVKGQRDAPEYGGPENQDGVYGIVVDGGGWFYDPNYDVVYHDTHYTLYDGGGGNERFTSKFSVGDAVEISGCTVKPQNNKFVSVKNVSDHTLTVESGTFAEGTETGTITISRDVPDMSFICSHDNRIWGCGGSTIYASALGDPRNFERKEGISTDSYALEIGSEGEFTGCISYGEGVLFFKEQRVHKILGDTPQNYELRTYQINGLQKSSHRSLQVVNEVLYYKGVDGFYAYTGGVPQSISRRLGTQRYGKAAATMPPCRMSPENGVCIFTTLRKESGCRRTISAPRPSLFRAGRCTSSTTAA